MDVELPSEQSPHWVFPLKEDTTDRRYYVTSCVFALETIANSGYMTSDSDGRYALENFDATKFVPYETNAGQIIPSTKFAQSNNLWRYNKDYHSLLDFMGVPIQDCADKCNTKVIYKYPYRVYRSATFSKESNDLYWRIFKSGDYYKVIRNKGVIHVLRTMNKTLLIHTQQTLLVAAPKYKIGTDNLEAYLGTGDIFEYPPEEVTSVNQGYNGCQSKWSAVVTRIGYVSIDMAQGKVMLFNGNSNDELSDEGTRNYFIDLFKAGSTEDNPFFGSGLSVAWDEKNSRILVTKIVRTDLESYQQLSFTLSYSLLKNRWISNHDYIPSLLYFNRNGLYSVNNGFNQNQGSVFVHNSGNIGVFYGEVKPAYVDILIRSNKLRWQSIQWFSYCKLEGNLRNDLTFTHMMVFNDHQCSGLLELKREVTLPYNDRNMVNNVQEWSFNTVKDHVVDQKLSFMDNKGNLINTNIDTSKVWFNRSRLKGNFIIVRFYTDNSDQRQLTLVDFKGYAL